MSQVGLALLCLPESKLIAQGSEKIIRFTRFRGVVLVFLINNRRPGLVALGLLALAAVSVASGSGQSAKSAITRDQAQQRTAEQSRRFIGNAGQWNSKALFLARSGKMDMWITREGFTYDFYRLATKGGEQGKYGQVVQMSFGGAQEAKTVGVSKTGMETRYIRPNGSHSADSFAEVLQKGIYPGIDARSYFDGALPRYDLVVAPNANPDDIKLVFKGANKVSVKNGEVVLATNVGSQKHGRLFAYQVKNGKRVQVRANFELVGKNSVRFALGNYDKSLKLVIDPLIYGSYYGGNNGADQVSDVTSDAKGGVYLTGWTMSANFPAIFGPYGFTPLGQRDGFISKLQGDAYRHDYAAYFGGSGNDEGMHIDVDPFGDVWIAGITSSGNFPGGNLQYLKQTSNASPTAGSFTITYPGIGSTAPLAYNASPADVKAALESLLGVTGVKVTNQVVGNPRLNKGGIYKIILPVAFPANLTVDSTALSPTSTYSVPARAPFVFLMRWRQDPDTVLTPFPKSIMYFGGEQSLTLINMAIVPNSNPDATEPVRLTFAGTQANGVSNSDVPEKPIAGSNGFIARYEFDRASRNFLRIDALTHFIGSTDGRADVQLNGMVVDRFGSIYTGGTVIFNSVADTATDPVFLTTPGVFSEGRLLRRSDMFVRKYGANGSIVYSALIGGNNDESAGGIDTDPAGATQTVGTCVAIDESLNLYITGIGRSFNYPRTRGVYGEVFNESPVVVCTKINADASQILYSTHLRTTGTMLPAGIGVDNQGNAVITGNAHADMIGWPDATLGGAIDPTKAGDPNEPDDYIKGGIPVTDDAIDNNWEENDTTTPDGRTHPASFSAMPEMPTSEAWVLVLNSTATNLVYGSYIGELTDERVFAPYIDQVGDVWFCGYVDTSRSYRIFSSQGIPTDHFITGGLNWHINELAFKRFPDTGSQNRVALAARWGTWNVAFPFYVTFNWSATADPPGSPKPTQTMQYQRDGFIIKQRFTIPSVDSVQLNPATAPGGLGVTIQGLVTLSQAAPVGGAIVTLELSNNAGSFTPAPGQLTTTINIPAGATQGAFTVYTEPVNNNTNVQVKAGYQGSFKIAQFVVVPWLTQLTLSPTSVVGGNQATGRITLAEPAPAGGAQVDLTTDMPNLISFPGGNQVVVPAGQTSVVFTIDTEGVAENTFPTIRASLLGTGKSQTLTLTQANLRSLVLSPSRVAGGTTTTGTVFLDGKAGSSFTVNVLIDDGTPGYVITPKTLTFDPGDTQKSFTIKTAFESSNTTRKITAVRPIQGAYTREQVSTTLFIDAVFLTNFTLSPTTINGGDKSTGVVTISSPAPAGGVVVNLKSSNTAIATVPSQVIVPAGASNASFDILGQTIAVDKTVTITATRGTTVIAHDLTVKGVTFTMSVDPASVIGGRDTATGTIVLSNPAPAGGVTIKLKSSNTAVATVPDTVTVSAGNTVVTFPVTTMAVSGTKSVIITATLGTNTVAVGLEVRQVGVQMVTFTPSTVQGGNTTLVTITLEAPAPAGGANVTLSASNPDVFVLMPASVQVAAGQTTVSFTVRTVRVARDLASTLTATYGGSSGSATLNITR
jgi:hypothetical protein